MAPRKRQFNRFVFLRLFAYLVIAGGGAALAASFLFDLNRPHIGLALIISGLLSLLSLRHRTGVRPSGPTNEGRSKLLRTLGPAFVVILLTPTAWIITDRNDIVFFVAVALGSTLLVRAIFDTRRGANVGAFLGAIVLLQFEVVWRMLQLSSGPIGVDPWFHVSIVRDIAISGTVPAAAQTYAAFPLFHILGAQVALLLGLSPFVTLSALSATLVVTPVFVFLTSRRVLSTAGALLATLLFALSDYFLFWTVWVSPTSFGILFFAATLYCAVSLDRSPSRIRIALIITMVAVVLLHPLATVFTILALALFQFPRWARTRRLKLRHEFSLGSILALFVVLTLAWWLYSLAPGQTDLISRFALTLSRVLYTFQLGATQAVTVASASAYPIVLARDSGLSTMLIIFPVGLVALGKQAEAHLSTVASLTLLSALFMGLPFFAGIGGQALLLPDRWFVFGYVFACIAGAFALAILLYRPAKQGRVATSLVVGLIVLVMVSSPLGSAVRPAYTQAAPIPRYFLTSEIQAPEIVLETKTPSLIVTDGRYAEQVIGLWYGLGDRYVILTPGFSLRNLTQSELLVVRTGLHQELLFNASRPTTGYYWNLPQAFWNQLDATPMVSRIYDDGGVWIYVAS